MVSTDLQGQPLALDPPEIHEVDLHPAQGGVLAHRVLVKHLNPATNSTNIRNIFESISYFNDLREQVGIPIWDMEILAEVPGRSLRQIRKYCKSAQKRLCSEKCFLRVERMELNVTSFLGAGFVIILLSGVGFEF